MQLVPLHRGFDGLASSLWGSAGYTGAATAPAHAGGKAAMLTSRFAMRPLRLQKVSLNFAFLCELVLFDKLGEAGPLVSVP